MKKRYQVLEYIIRHKMIHDGNAPTMREIGDMCEISSTSVVNYYLDKLADEGLIRLEAGTARGIEVVGGKWRYENSPVG